MSDQDYTIKPPPKEQAGQGRHSYRVVYEIDVYATSPEDAGRQVEEIFRDPEAIPPMFTVLDSDGHKTEVDLYAEGLEEHWGPTGIVALPEDPESWTQPAPGAPPA